MEKTTGTAKVTMEAFGEKFEQTGSAVIAFVIKPDGREEGTMSMAMGGSSVRDIITAASERRKCGNVTGRDRKDTYTREKGEQR